MFLDVIRRRNPRLIDAAITLHQRGEIPADTYVIDLDAVAANAHRIAESAAQLGLTVFAMTKQVGRNPDLCAALVANGIPAAVGVDMECSRSAVRNGMRLGHVGHLVQVPRAEADAAAALLPDYWTVFSLDKAREAAAAAQRLGREQPVMARIHAPGDEFYSGHEGGFDADEIARAADDLDGLDGVRFAGITTFPALLFDPDRRALRQTHNLRTLERAAEALRSAGRDDIQINGPGTTSTVALAALSAAGVTQVEPGHALTGTTPLHAVSDLAELPAVCYVSEVSHLYGDRAYCFGGGMYVDPVFPPYQIRAVAGQSADSTRLLDATLPPSAAIDYYGQLDLNGAPLGVGDSVVFGFRIQAFVTRAYTAAVSGLDSNNPAVAGIWTATGLPTSWPR